MTKQSLQEKNDHALHDDEHALRRTFTKHRFLGSIVIEPTRDEPGTVGTWRQLWLDVHNPRVRVNVSTTTHDKRLYVFVCEAHELSPDEEHDMFERMSVRFAQMAIDAKKRRG